MKAVYLHRGPFINQLNLTLRSSSHLKHRLSVALYATTCVETCYEYATSAGTRHFCQGKATKQECVQEHTNAVIARVLNSKPLQFQNATLLSWPVLPV